MAYGGPAKGGSDGERRFGRLLSLLKALVELLWIGAVWLVASRGSSTARANARSGAAEARKRKPTVTLFGALGLTVGLVSGVAAVAALLPGAKAGPMPCEVVVAHVHALGAASTELSAELCVPAGSGGSSGLEPATWAGLGAIGCAGLACAILMCARFRREARRDAIDRLCVFLLFLGVMLFVAFAALALVHGTPGSVRVIGVLKKVGRYNPGVVTFLVLAALAGLRRGLIPRLALSAKSFFADARAWSRRETLKPGDGGARALAVAWS
jgi:hypothetical protein